MARSATDRIESGKLRFSPRADAARQSKDVGDRRLRIGTAGWSGQRRTA